MAKSEAELNGFCQAFLSISHTLIAYAGNAAFLGAENFAHHRAILNSLIFSYNMITLFLRRSEASIYLTYLLLNVLILSTLIIAD